MINELRVAIIIVLRLGVTWLLIAALQNIVTVVIDLQWMNADFSVRDYIILQVLKIIQPFAIAIVLYLMGIWSIKPLEGLNEK